MHPFGSFRWLNQPSTFEHRGDDLFVRTDNATDYWRETFYGFRRDSGHFFYRPVEGDFSAEVTLSGKFESLYDQAGLMVRLSESHWVKAGIEYTDGAMHFSVVVTNDRSDWSMQKIRVDNGMASMRVTRHAEAIRIQYLDQDDQQWKPARLAFLPATAAIDVGLMTCSPERAGFEVTFKDLIVGPPISRQLHD